MITTKRLLGGRVKVQHMPRRMITLRLGIGIAYAEKNGHPVLREETSWRKVNGIWINTKNNNLWILFRRF